MHAQKFQLRNIHKMPGFKGKKPAPEKSSKTPAALDPVKQKKLNNSFLSAAKRGKVGEMKMFLERGADVNATDKDGNNALLLLLEKYPEAEVTQSLIDMGINVSAGNKRGRTPIKLTIHLSDYKNMEVIVASGKLSHQERIEAAEYAYNFYEDIAPDIICDFNIFNNLVKRVG